MEARRWDLDTRGRGIASATAFAPAAERLLAAMRLPDWVAEEPEHHLLPHVRRLCDERGWALRRAEVEQAVLVLEVAVGPASWRELRAAGFQLIGTFAEAHALVAQRDRDDGGIELDVTTGMLEGDGDFAPHGHTVRLRVAR